MGGGKKENYKEDTDSVGKGKGTSQCPPNKVWCHLVATSGFPPAAGTS